MCSHYQSIYGGMQNYCKSPMCIHTKPKPQTLNPSTQSETQYFPLLVSAAHSLVRQGIDSSTQQVCDPKRPSACLAKESDSGFGGLEFRVYRVWGLWVCRVSGFRVRVYDTHYPDCK